LCALFQENPVFRDPFTPPSQLSATPNAAPDAADGAVPHPAAESSELRPRGWAAWLDSQVSTRVHSVLAVAAFVAATVLSSAGIAHASVHGEPAILAADSLEAVVNNVRLWLIGILAALATLFLTIGAVRYLAAGGDPSEVEKAKIALKSAAIGYCLALLAPVLVTLLAKLVA
jgi:hypothetical protein